jgi:hypothetical protein
MSNQLAGALFNIFQLSIDSCGQIDKLDEWANIISIESKMYMYTFSFHILAKTIDIAKRFGYVENGSPFSDSASSLKITTVYDLRDIRDLVDGIESKYITINIFEAEYDCWRTVEMVIQIPDFLANSDSIINLFSIDKQSGRMIKIGLEMLLYKLKNP